MLELDSSFPRRRFGHIADHAGVVQMDLERRPVAAHPAIRDANLVGLPTEIDLTVNLDMVPDQGQTSSCVGNAFSTGFYLLARYLGFNIPRPSRKEIYDLARMIDVPYQMLSDDGSRPAAAMLGAQQYGLVTEERWPLTDANVNDKPPLDVFAHAIGAKVGSYYRIAPGSGCSDGVRLALSRGYPVPFAMPVDAAYESYDGSGIYQGLMGSILGGHMQCAVGYGPDYILVCNSWSPSWGLRGLSRVAPSWFDGGQVTDLLVATMAPSEVS